MVILLINQRNFLGGGDMDEFNNNEEKNKNKYMKKVKKGLLKLTDKDGFYIILFICICILGTTGVWVATRDRDDAEENNKDEMNVIENYYLNPPQLKDINVLPDFNDLGVNADSDENKNNLHTDNHSQVKAANIQKPTQTKEDNQQTQDDQDKKTSSTKVDVSQNQQQNRVISMVLPTNGTITKEFAVDKLVYSKTLEQWTTHNGIDITAREGSVVRAALDGVVASINSDDELGISITLDHGGGLTTLYAGLSTDEMVKVGQSVKKGQTISGVGKAVGFELAQGPHLHFEVSIDGKNVDPTQYIPNTQ